MGKKAHGSSNTASLPSVESQSDGKAPQKQLKVVVHKDTPKMVAEEKKIDELLKERLLFRKKIPKDGSCLFRAVADQIYNNQSRHLELRRHCVDHMMENADLFSPFVTTEKVPFHMYLQEMQKTKTWGSDVEIQALANILSASFVIYELQGESLQVMKLGLPEYEAKYTIRLAFCYGNHYDSIFNLEHLDNVMSCQEVVLDVIFFLFDIKMEGTITCARYQSMEYDEWNARQREQGLSDAKIARQLHEEELKEARRKKTQENKDLQFAKEFKKLSTKSPANANQTSNEWTQVKHGRKGKRGRQDGQDLTQKLFSGSDDGVSGSLENLTEDEMLARAMQESLEEAAGFDELYPPLPVAAVKDKAEHLTKASEGVAPESMTDVQEEAIVSEPQSNPSAQPQPEPEPEPESEPKPESEAQPAPAPIEAVIDPPKDQKETPVVQTATLSWAAIALSKAPPKPKQQQEQQQQQQQQPITPSTSPQPTAPTKQLNQSTRPNSGGRGRGSHSSRGNAPRKKY